MSPRLRFLFLFEAIVTVGSGAYAMAWPRSFLSQFSSAPLPMGAETALPLFGVLCIVMGLVEWRLVKQANQEALIVFMQGFLVGDMLYIAAFSQFVAAYGEWNIFSIFAVALVVFYALCRCCFLLACANSQLNHASQ